MAKISQQDELNVSSHQNVTRSFSAPGNPPNSRMMSLLKEKLTLHQFRESWEYLLLFIISCWGHPAVSVRVSKDLGFNVRQKRVRQPSSTKLCPMKQLTTAVLVSETIPAVVSSRIYLIYLSFHIYLK